MGVQGLSSFIEANSQIYRDVQFRDSRLVIDGCNLCCQLLFSSGLDQKHGGDYGAFADLLEKFVKALRDCGIEPYVVLDGGDDQTDKKLETLKKRAERRIRTAHEMSLGRHGNILPPLVKLLFIQTLARLQVPVAVSFAEADQQIAALASEWKCPVLSNDSDFYIFDLPAGLLPLSHFRWKKVVQTGSQRSIPCKSYTASSFCTFFNIQRQILPAFAALAGNDYVKLGEMGLTPGWEHTGTGSAGRLEELLRWLRGFQRPLEALEAAVMLMGNLSRQREAEVLQALSLGMEEYQLPFSYLNRFFTDGTVPPLPPEAQGLVPDWARLPLTQGRLTKETLNVLLLRRVRLGIMVDHGSLPSAHLISRPVRQVMYGLLLGGGRRVQVEENDREGLQQAKVLVRPVCRGAAQALKLDSLQKAKSSRRLRVLMEALEVKPSCFSGLPPHLHLPVAATCYWLQQSRPPPHLKLLQVLLLEALLLGLVTKHAQTEIAGSGALELETRHPAHKLDHDVVHAFNQWQACLKDSIHLNQLLGFPLLEPPVAWLYQGTLVCHMVRRLREGTHPTLLLERRSLKLYRKLLTAVLQARGQETTASSAAGRRRKARQQHTTPSVDDLTTCFEQRLSLDKDHEVTDAEKSALKAEEDQSWELVSVRTRYRAKDRGHRSKIPELARKRESRGWD